MDNAQVDKIIKAIEAQNKNLDKTVELLKRIDENIKSLNNKTAKPDDFAFLKTMFDKTVFTSMVLNIDSIHELLKNKLK